MRARNIKPGFFKNEDLAECSMAARLLFPGLWMMADRMGRMEYRPKRIKGELFPFDTIDAEPLLKELSQWGLIKIYEVDGKKLIWIPCFLAHQNPHHREKTSDIPRHPDDTNVEGLSSDDDHSKADEPQRSTKQISQIIPYPNLIHQQEQSSPEQAQGLPKACPDIAQGLPNACPDMAQGQAEPRHVPAVLNPESLILNPITDNAFSIEKAQGDPAASFTVSKQAKQVQNGLNTSKHAQVGLKNTKHFTGRLVLKHKPPVDNKKILDDIIITCRKIQTLPPKKHDFNPFQLVQMWSNQRGHPLAIIDTLKGLVEYWDSTESPFSYAKTIMKTKSQNYNEQDHFRESDAFKEVLAAPEIMAIFQAKGFSDGHQKANSGS